MVPFFICVLYAAHKIASIKKENIANVFATTQKYEIIIIENAIRSKKFLLPAFLFIMIEFIHALMTGFFTKIALCTSSFRWRRSWKIGRSISAGRRKC